MRSALLLVSAVLVAALLMLPFSAGRVGSGGPNGLMLAAAICLATAGAAELLSCALHGGVSPLLLMLTGMAIRMLPPLAICVVLAARGANGREYLPFIVYLLAFYLVTLALETWLTVSRLASQTNSSSRTAQ